MVKLFSQSSWTDIIRCFNIYLTRNMFTVWIHSSSAFSLHYVLPCLLPALLIADFLDRLHFWIWLTWCHARLAVHPTQPDPRTRHAADHTTATSRVSSKWMGAVEWAVTDWSVLSPSLSLCFSPSTWPIWRNRTWNSTCWHTVKGHIFEGDFV